MTPDLFVKPATRFEPPESFVDPRTESGFKPHLWPGCGENGAPPIGTQDLHERRSIEFLAAYYWINCLHAELATSRQADASQKKIREALTAIETALEELDRLEDRYTPIGFYGEPKMNGVFYESIAFRRPELPRILPQASSLSSHLAIPGIADLPPEELTGSVVITRWSHGKVDL